MFCNQLQKALGRVEFFAAVRNPAPISQILSRFGLAGPYRAIRAAHSFTRAHDEDPYHLAITNGYSGWPLRFADPGIPVIQVYHFTLAGLARTALPLRGDMLTTARLGGWFERISGKGTKVVSVSETVRREVRRYYGLESIVIPDGVDERLFRRLDRAEARRRLRLPPSSTIGLFVARPEYAKGFDVLQRVAQSMDDVLFLSASRPAEAPSNVRFISNVPHSEMPILYSAADFFFSPSRYEGFNLALLEALFCELPAVLTRNACAFSLNPSELGVVIDDPTPEAFVVGIRQALREGASAGLRQRIVKQFSLETFVRNWRRLVATVISETPGSTGDS